MVFAGDNGPEEVLLWRGTPGYWEGSCFAGGEGNLRTPCIVRWPGRIPAGQVSDDIMHVTDWFTTLLHAASAAVPGPRDPLPGHLPVRGDHAAPALTGSASMTSRQGGSLRSYGASGSNSTRTPMPRSVCRLAVNAGWLAS